MVLEKLRIVLKVSDSRSFQIVEAIQELSIIGQLIKTFLNTDLLAFLISTLVTFYILLVTFVFRLRGHSTLAGADIPLQLHHR